MPTYRGRRSPTPIETRPARAVELRNARVTACLTQRELAALAGTDQSNIAHYETGTAMSQEKLEFLLKLIAAESEL